MPPSERRRFAAAAAAAAVDVAMMKMLWWRFAGDMSSKLWTRKNRRQIHRPVVTSGEGKWKIDEGRDGEKRITGFENSNRLNAREIFEEINAWEISFQAPLSFSSFFVSFLCFYLCPTPPPPPAPTPPAPSSLFPLPLPPSPS